MDRLLSKPESPRSEINDSTCILGNRVFRFPSSLSVKNFEARMPPFEGQFMKNQVKLISVAVFYRNNAPGGIGLMFKLFNRKLRDQFKHTTDLYDKAWAESNAMDKADLIKLYFDQLNQHGAMDAASRSDEWDWLMVVNIWFLEKHGHLRPDEFNGCMFTYCQ